MIIKFVKSILIFIFISCSGGESEEEVISLNEQNNNLKSEYIPTDYNLVTSDEFDSFENNNWSKGLTHSTNSSVRMIWNKNTGGENLLNNNYDGYLLDDNVYVNNGLLYLENRKQSITGTDPVGQFNYSTGWVNSLQKINFNGTIKNIYLEIKAKFPKGDKVWPAIWLIDDSENRKWPPEIDIWEYFGKFLILTEVMKCICVIYMVYGTIKRIIVMRLKIFNRHTILHTSFMFLALIGLKMS